MLTAQTHCTRLSSLEKGLLNQRVFLQADQPTLAGLAPDDPMSDYYRSHWEEIEPDRAARYDEMLQWAPHMEPLLAGFPLADGMSVLDYGCGPGWVSLELARRVAPNGSVLACDLNAEMLALGRRHAAEAGLDQRLTWAQVTDDRVPATGASLDRVHCKNVLEYVPSIDDLLSEFKRVLKPGGLMRLIDSDWGLLTVEPIGAERLGEMMAAASHAYNDAHAGRHLYGAARRAGFQDVKVQVLAGPDTQGRLRPVLQNMAGYAALNGYPKDKSDALLADFDQAVERGEALTLLPQFVVTATA
jgi:ubiquinone/menaquinone biosynthesis C-methylase UbiE